MTIKVVQYHCNVPYVFSNVGEVIVGLKLIDDFWWEGQVGTNVGMFPVTHVMELEVSGLLKERSRSVHSAEPLFAQALVDAVAQLDEELGFQAGDIITVTQVVDEDWYVGECRGKSGMFLAACVQLLNEDECNSSGPKSSSNNSDIRQNSGKTSVASSFHNSQTVSSVSASAVVTDITHIKGEHHNSESRNPNVTNHDNQSSDTTCSRVNHDRGGKYTSENTKAHTGDGESGVTPYARALFPFSGESAGELTFDTNDIVTLIQHVDQNWIEGEIDGNIGLFPANFVEIVVDCPYAYSTDNSESLWSPSDINNQTEETPLESDETCKQTPSYVRSVSDTEESYALVLYNFDAETSNDLTVHEGETVTVVQHVDDNWVYVRNDAGQSGMCPAAFVDIISSLADNHKNTHDNNDNEINTDAHQEPAVSVNVIPATPSVTKPEQLPDQRPPVTSNAENKPSLKPKPSLAPKPQLKPKPSLSPKPFSSEASTVKPVSLNSGSELPKSNSTKSLAQYSASVDFEKQTVRMTKAHSMYEMNSTDVDADLSAVDKAPPNHETINTSKVHSTEAKKTFQSMDLSKPLENILQEEFKKARIDKFSKSKSESVDSSNLKNQSIRKPLTSTSTSLKNHRTSGNYARENFEEALGVGQSTFYTGENNPVLRKPPPPPPTSKTLDRFARRPSLKRPAPPRPVGPKIPPAPTKTTTSAKQTSPRQYTVSRPAPPRPGPLPAPPRGGASVRGAAPPRPQATPSGGDLMSFSPSNSSFCKLSLSLTYIFWQHFTKYLHWLIIF